MASNPRSLGFQQKSLVPVNLILLVGDRVVASQFNKSLVQGVGNDIMIVRSGLQCTA
jgi:hypothetical protein